jgi:hypothetical protein
MRSLLTSLIVLCLTASGVRAELPPPPPADVTTPDAGVRSASWTVEGYGKTLQDADEAALQKAKVEVLSYLDRQNPPLDALVAAWQEKKNQGRVLAFIDTNLVRHREEEVKVVPDLGEGYQRTLQVEIGPKEYRALVDQDRQERVGQRDYLLAKILAGVVAVLLAVAGYFRLEDLTKGYYTGWLRLGAFLVALAGIVGSGFWILH